MEEFLRDTVGFDECTTQEYVDVFNQNAIGLDILPMIDNIETLKGIGVKLGDGLRIMKKVGVNPSSSSSSSSNTPPSSPSQPSPSPPSPSVPTCTTHEGQPLIGLCQQDGHLLCQSCKLVTPHSDHICVSPTEAVDCIREALHNWNPTSDLQTQITNQETEIQTLQTEMQTLEDKLNTAREKLQELKVRAEKEQDTQQTIKAALETHPITKSTTHQQSVVAMTSLHTLWHDLGQGPLRTPHTIPPTEWMETSDEAGGFRKHETNNIWFAVSKETTCDFPTIKRYCCPPGYHWMSTAEYEAELQRSHPGQHNAYCGKAGWDGWTWKGKERRYFVFSDSDVTKKCQFAGHYPRTTDLPMSGPVINDFAGLVCGKN